MEVMTRYATVCLLMLVSLTGYYLMLDPADGWAWIGTRIITPVMWWACFCLALATLKALEK